MAPKLVVVVGITGNQGGSVARRFLQDPNYRVRGLTRNPNSPAAQAIAAEGVEVVPADLEDPTSVKAAFAGANLIFTVTNHWEPFYRPDFRAKADEQGISYARMAYLTEVRHGRHMADAAAATIDTLDDNGLIASTEGDGNKATDGKYGKDAMLHFDGKCHVFPDYVNEKYPELAKKMSLVWTGTFTLTWTFVPWQYFAKIDDNTYVRRLTTSPDKPIPHIDIERDLGNFIYAVSQMPPGKTYLAAGQVASWSEYMQIWGKVTGKNGSYEQVSEEDIIKSSPDPPFGKELAEMMSMFSDVGLWCGRDDLVTAEDIRKAGIDCPMTDIEESSRHTDWTKLFNQ